MIGATMMDQLNGAATTLAQIAEHLAAIRSHTAAMADTLARIEAQGEAASNPAALLDALGGLLPGAPGR